MPQILSKALDMIKTIKSGDPVLNLDRSAAAESLWPAALEKEADKAASILRSFFIDGFIVPYRTLGTCPREVRRRPDHLAFGSLLTWHRLSADVVDLLSCTFCVPDCTLLLLGEAVSSFRDYQAENGRALPPSLSTTIFLRVSMLRTLSS